MIDLLPVIQDLSQAVSVYEEKRRRLSREQKLAVLGAKFTLDIARSSDPEELSNIMIEANRISFSAGVPELAGQINNLGRIQMGAIDERKKVKLTSEANELAMKTYGEQMVLSNDNYVPLSSTEEFKNVAKNYSPEMQAAAYQTLSTTNATQLIRQIYPEGDELGLYVYAVNKKGESKLVQQLAPGAGGYDDLLTAAEERIGVPPEIAQQQVQMQLEEDKMDRQLSKQISYAKWSQEQELMTPRTAFITDDSGQEVEKMIFFEKQKDDTYKAKEFGTNKDIDFKNIARYHATGYQDPMAYLGKLNANVDQQQQEYKDIGSQIVTYRTDLDFAGTDVAKVLSNKSFESASNESKAEQLLLNQDVIEEIAVNVQRENEAGKPGKWTELNNLLGLLQNKKNQLAGWKKLRDAFSSQYTGVTDTTTTNVNPQENNGNGAIDDIIFQSAD